LFSQHIGAAPVTVAQTRRVLLAKQLIHQTELSMIEVALASGFGSVRRFNETFQKMYRRPPSELRRRAASGVPSPEVTILLPYRPPYDWEALLDFFRLRAIAGLEVVTRDSYSRVIELDEVVGTLHVSHVAPAESLRVTVRIPRLAALPTIISRVRRQFDLGAEPNAIAAALSTDPMLAPLVASRPGLRVPGAWDGFEVAVRAVLGQQITVKAATTLASRIVVKLGTKVAEESGAVGLTQVFPRPEEFSNKSLAKLGMTGSRAKCLVGIAEAAQADARLFEPRRDLAEAVAQLKKLGGVGEWTAQYIALRTLGESDAFLAGDVALQRGFARQGRGRGATAEKILARAERWRPWRAYAALHLWMASADAGRPAANKENYDAISA
jgi:AraC family transcriptional regulator of adaptative response / DNA-3-methyladenine glycosylase II